MTMFPTRVTPRKGEVYVDKKGVFPKNPDHGDRYKVQAETDPLELLPPGDIPSESFTFEFEIYQYDKGLNWWFYVEREG